MTDEETVEQAVDSLNTLKETVFALLGNVQDMILAVGGGIIMLMVIISGIRYMTGDVKGGKAGIIAAAIGTAIVLLAYTIMSLLCSNVGGGACPTGQ